MVWVTTIVNIFVVLLKVSVALPVAVEPVGGFSLAPFNVAMNVTTSEFEGGLSSLLSQESRLPADKAAKAIRVTKKFFLCIMIFWF